MSLNAYTITHFNDPGIYHDRVVVIGFEKFHVLSQVLSLASDYFKVLFSNTSFKEAGETEIVMKELSANCFSLFLRAAYPKDTLRGVNFLSSNTPAIYLEGVQIAHRLMSPVFLRYCLKAIHNECNNSGLKNFNLIKYIELALLLDQKEMKEFAYHALSDMSYAAEIAPQIGEASNEVHKFITMSFLQGKIRKNYDLFGFDRNGLGLRHAAHIEDEEADKIAPW